MAPLMSTLLLLLQVAAATAEGGKTALIIGSHDFLGKAAAHELVQAELFDSVFLLDHFTRERLVAPWEVYLAGQGMMSAFAPTTELADDGVTVLRCDRSLPCLTEIMTSRSWDLVVDLTPEPSAAGDSSFVTEYADYVSHYVLVSSAAVYGSCLSSGAGLRESSGVQTDCENEHSEPWRALEAPLWAGVASVEFTVLRIPDVLGEMEPSRSLAPWLQGLLQTKAGQPLAFPGRRPGGRSSQFSVAHVSDVAEAILAVAQLAHGADTSRAASVFGQAFNVATASPTNLDDFVADLKNVFGLKTKLLWREDRDCPFPTIQIGSPLDTSKATKTFTGIWTPSRIDDWLPELVQWMNPEENKWYGKSKSVDVEEYSPEINAVRMKVEDTLYKLIEACATDDAIVALAQPGAIDKDALRMMWARFMYLAAPVGVVQAHWAVCMHKFEAALRDVSKGKLTSSSWLGSEESPEPAESAEVQEIAAGNTTELLLLQDEDWTRSLLRVLLLSGDAADVESLELVAKSLLYQSRTTISWSWPPAVWGKTCEMLIMVGELSEAAEVLERALKFWSRRTIVESWELRLEDIATSRSALESDGQPKIAADASGTEENNGLTPGALPIPVLDQPSMAEFVEKCALPQMAVVITGEVDNWPAKGWRAEGRFARSCPNAAATMTYFQPEASLEFAGLAQSRRMGMAEYMSDFIVDEKMLADGRRGAAGRMATHDDANRTGLSTRSPYLWDLSLHDECPQVLPDIRVPKYFADELLTQGVPMIGGDSMVVWPTMMLGGAGTGSACHQDRKATPFWLAMLVGNKRVIMYSAQDAHLLYPFGMQDQGSFTTFRFDPFAPDYEAFPNARSATMYEATVKRAHSSHSLRYLLSLDHASPFPNCCRTLPPLANMCWPAGRMTATLAYCTTAGEILWIPPLWVHCLVNEPGEIMPSQELSTDATASPDPLYEPKAPYALAMVFNYHDTFSLPDFIRHCDIEKPREDNLCMFMPSPQLVAARLSVRRDAVAAVEAKNRTRLEEVLGKVKAWGKDRWKYWEFRKLLGGRCVLGCCKLCSR
jgi:nucleoside-diphosphate-sugar epimerase